LIDPSGYEREQRDINIYIPRLIIQVKAANLDYKDEIVPRLETLIAPAAFAQSVVVKSP